MKQYKNRYGDVFTFTKDENHDILWEGNFEWCRYGMPNDYTMAYAEYLREGGDMELDEFKVAVHEWDDEKFQHKYPKYISMVASLKNEIDMVDPSGGCYLARGMKLDFLGFKDFKVKDFEMIDTGYKIVTEKCPMCHQAGGVHKMGCETRKITL